MGSRISVVTPSLDQAQYISTAIDSVLNQDYPSLEYIVVDGGSQDNTRHLLERYERALEWVSEPDRGQAEAINKGFRRTTGDILGWLNADDLYAPVTLKEVALQFANNPELMMLYGDAYHIDAEGSIIDRYSTSDYHWENLAFHCFVCQPTCFFRRSLIEKAGYLDPQLHYALDLDLWIRFGLAQRQNPTWKFTYLPKVLAYSRMHLENKTLSKRKESLQEVIQVVKKYFDYVSFNWVYALKESADGRFDGYFRRSPPSLHLMATALSEWIWINRSNPAYVFSSIKECLGSPRDSISRLARRTARAGTTDRNGPKRML